MKKLLFVYAISALMFACKKKHEPPTVKLPMSYINITIAGNTYSDSSSNDTTTSVSIIKFSVMNVKDYATQKPMYLLNGRIGTKNLSSSVFYAQKRDTSSKSGTYTTGLTYVTWGNNPEIRITDRKTNRNYSACDSVGVINITSYNENEVSGNFSFNMKGEIDAIIYPVTGDFKYKIK